MANEFIARKGLIALDNSGISGSLDVSGSLTIESSGSTLFEIIGSEGQLFSVTDNLSGSLFAVSDVSGLPILEVFSDDTIKIGTFNNEAIIVNGSTAIVSGSFSGSFEGDGSGLTGISAAAGTLSSSAQIATEISGAFDSVSASLAANIPTNNNQLTNGAGYTTNTGTVTSVGGTGTVNGLSLSGTVTTSGNLTLGGTISISSTNITDVDAFSQSGTYASLRAQGTTAGDVGLGNVTNESKATMFTSPTFTGTVAIPGFADVSASLAAAVAGGDNLGNHTASLDLNMDGNDIIGANNIITTGNINGVDVSTLKSDFDTLEGKTLVSSSAQTVANLDGQNVTVNSLTVENSSTGFQLKDSSGTSTYVKFSPQGGLEIDPGGTGNSISASSDITTHGDIIGKSTHIKLIGPDGGGGSFTYLSSSGDPAAGGFKLSLGDIDGVGNTTTITINDNTEQISLSKALSVTGNITVTGTVDGVDIASLETSVQANDTEIASLTAATSSYLTSGDNLGNHTATQDLDISNNAIINVASITGSDSAAIEITSYPIGYEQLAAFPITGSGLVIRENGLPANNYPMLKIGDVEMVDINSTLNPNLFLIHNVDSFLVASGSEPVNLFSDGPNKLFEHTGDDFNIYTKGIDAAKMTVTSASVSITDAKLQIGGKLFNVASETTIEYIAGYTGVPNPSPIYELGVQSVSSVIANTNREFDTGSSALASNGGALGDVVKFGGTTTTAGGLYYLNSSGGWTLAQANAGGTSTGSLAVALGTNSTTDGMLLRGFVNPSSLSDAGIGAPVYVASASAGGFSGLPSQQTGEIVRVVGHAYGTDLVYFNPSSDYIEIA